MTDGIVEDESAEQPWPNGRTGPWTVYPVLFVDAINIDNPNHGGVHTGFESTRSYIGDLMNDRTSSLQWS